VRGVLFLSGRCAQAFERVWKLVSDGNKCRLNRSGEFGHLQDGGCVGLIALKLLITSKCGGVLSQCYSYVVHGESGSLGKCCRKLLLNGGVMLVKGFVECLSIQVQKFVGVVGQFLAAKLAQPSLILPNALSNPLFSALGLLEGGVYVLSDLGLGFLVGAFQAQSKSLI